MKVVKIILIVLTLVFLCSCGSSRNCSTKSVNWNSAIIR